MKNTDYLPRERVSTGLKVAVWITSIILFALGCTMLWYGIKLISYGDTPYYAIAGALYIIAAIFNVLYRTWGAWLILLVSIGTFGWSYYEVGTNYWESFPRVLTSLGLAGVFLLLAAPFKAIGHRGLMRALGIICLVLLLAGIGNGFLNKPVVDNSNSIKLIQQDMPNKPVNWYAYGATNSGTRHAPFSQINRDNVNNLELVWNVDVERQDKPDPDAPQFKGEGPGIDQNTPMVLGNKIYYCSPHNEITAYEADSGKFLWKFNAKASGPIWQRCRGLTAYTRNGDISTVDTDNVAADNAAAENAAGDSASDYSDSGTEPQQCPTRIIMTTIDARMIALDAETGELCEDFGENGTVDLKQGMGKVEPGHYFQTSAPTVARGRVIVGGWVYDNVERGGPSGVIRAFDAETGKLDWAWDLANPNLTGMPPEGESYTRGTPNMWSTAAYDDKLGLVYIPLGNETPDYNSINRMPASEKYNATLVALDVETGKERWKFQTTHHDIWDYDLPSQPALVDLKDDDGKTVPAVMQTTKRGQVFLLNRETGKPLANVEEKDVPTTGAVEGETLSPTQPYSTGMPVVGHTNWNKPLNAKDTWGTTILDQMMCRVQFHELNYKGDFTPPSLQPTIQDPGNLGGMNWGSVSFDEANQLAFVNDVRMPNIVQQFHRDDFKAKFDPDHIGDGHSGISEQRGTPYAVKVDSFWLSKIGAPCLAPPWGTITAIDMKTRQIAWQIPAGTADELGPFGVASHLPMKMGLPTYAGTMSTSGGLVFFAGFQDRHIRAYDMKNGQMVWEYELPWGSSSTPMSYISPKTGKQYIALVVGGAAHREYQGTRLMVWALPEDKIAKH